MVTLCRWTGRHRETLRKTVDGRLTGYECVACHAFLPIDIAEPAKWARTLARRDDADRQRQASALYRRWKRQQTVLQMRPRRKA